MSNRPTIRYQKISTPGNKDIVITNNDNKESLDTWMKIINYYGADLFDNTKYESIFINKSKPGANSSHYHTIAIKVPIKVDDKIIETSWPIMFNINYITTSYGNRRKAFENTTYDDYNFVIGKDVNTNESSMKFFTVMNVLTSALYYYAKDIENGLGLGDFSGSYVEHKAITSQNSAKVIYEQLPTPTIYLQATLFAQLRGEKRFNPNSKFAFGKIINKDNKTNIEFQAIDTSYNSSKYKKSVEDFIMRISPEQSKIVTSTIKFEYMTIKSKFCVTAKMLSTQFITNTKTAMAFKPEIDESNTMFNDLLGMMSMDDDNNKNNNEQEEHKEHKEQSNKTEEDNEEEQRNIKKAEEMLSMLGCN